MKYYTCDACVHFLDVLYLYFDEGEGKVNLGKEILLESNLDFVICEVTAADICALDGYLMFYFMCLFLVGT